MISVLLWLAPSSGSEVSLLLVTTYTYLSSMNVEYYYLCWFYLDKMQFSDLIYNEYHYRCHLSALSGAKQHVYAWGAGLLYKVSRLLRDIAGYGFAITQVPVQYSMYDSQLLVSLPHQKMILPIFIYLNIQKRIGDWGCLMLVPLLYGFVCIWTVCFSQPALLLIISID